MKKTTKPLSLNRETLRTLAGVDLERAVGGMTNISYTCASRRCNSVNNTACTSCPSQGDCGLEKP